MYINDHEITEVTKAIIEFGACDEEEYKSLCATSYQYQGKALRSNFKYEEAADGPWWAFWRKSGENFTCKRVAANFEFPSKQWIDEWMKELPNYIRE